jgi:hypothetical protein
MKYLTIVLLLSVFLIGFVWQNIEVVKIKLEYKKMQEECSNIYKRNDLLKINLERLRTISKIEKAISGDDRYKKITPADIDSLKADSK